MIDSRCQFHQRYTGEVFVHTLFRQLFSSYMYVVKAAKMTLVQKTHAYNVDEIDCRRQLSRNRHIRPNNQVCNVTIVAFQIISSSFPKSILKIKFKLLTTDKVDFTKTTSKNNEEDIITIHWKRKLKDLIQSKIGGRSNSNKTFSLFILDPFPTPFSF